MRIRQPGNIREQLCFLGSEESCVYLLKGDNESMIISGGMSYLIPDLLQQFEVFSIDETKITKLLILHTHFDHVGIVPFLKRRNSKLEVYASTRGWEILHMKKAIDTLNDFSRNVAKRMGREKVYAIYDLDWRDDIRGMTIKEGDRINLGNLEICILDTPGHSSCSISAYGPHFKALFASEAGGIPYKESIIAFGNSNFTEFQQNLKKLKDLDVEYFCADHYGYVVGEEARNIIRHTISVARKHRASIKEAYRCTGNIETAAYQLTNAFYKENPDWIVSSEIVEGVYRQMLRHIVNTKEEYA